MTMGFLNEGFMFLRSLLFLFLTIACMGQTLPDRDELIAKFKVKETSDQAAIDLIKYYEMGGLRSIIRNVNELPPELRLQYAHVFRYMDLSRFRNDLNANVAEADNAETRAMWLMLLSTIGRMLTPDTFTKYSDDPGQPIMVRLAAASGLVQVQNPAHFDKFMEIAEEAEYDPGTGKNDFKFANISKARSMGLYFYSRGKVDNGTKDKPSQGQILTALYMAENNDADLYNAVLKLRSKKYVPLMIDRAIQIGSSDLLEVMAKDKFTKKRYKEPIAQAKTAAAAMASHRKSLYEYQSSAAMEANDSATPLGARVIWTGNGGGQEGYRSAYAIVKVSADGTMSILEHAKPYGGGDNIKESFSGKTLPAYIDWKPVDSTYLVVAP